MDRHRYTDACFVPEQAISAFTANEISAAVAQHWPFPTILVISIRPERFQRLLSGAGPLGAFVTEIAGIDGRELDMDRLIADGIYKAKNKMTRGQVACFMSHMKAWQYIVDHGLDNALILEDDCDLHPHPHTLGYVASCMREIDFPWDVLYLGRNPVLCEHKRTLRAHVIEPGITWGLFAYATSRTGAQRLLAEARMRPIDEYVDVFVSTVAAVRRRVALSPIVFGFRSDEISDTAGII